MTPEVQRWLAAGIVLLTLALFVRRWRRQRRSGSCGGCGTCAVKPRTPDRPVPR